MYKEIKYHRRVVLLAAVLLFPGFSLQGETLRVGYNNWVGFIGYFVAQEAGYFEDAGLTVEGSEFASPGEGLIPLINGDLDLHLTTMDSVVQRMERAQDSLEIIYFHDASTGADALIGGPDVESLKDLKGKTVGVTIGECNHLLLLKALRSVGLTYDDISARNLDPDAAGSALKAGAVQAAVTWEPWISQVVGEDDGTVLYSTEDAPKLIVDVLASNPSVAAEKEEAIEAFVAAVAKGNALAIENPAKASEIIADRLSLKGSQIQEMLEGLELHDLEENRALLNGGAMEPAEGLASFFVEQGIIRDVPNLENLFSDRFLPRAE